MLLYLLIWPARPHPREVVRGNMNLVQNRRQAGHGVVGALRSRTADVPVAPALDDIIEAAARQIAAIQARPPARTGVSAYAQAIAIATLISPDLSIAKALDQFHIRRDEVDAACQESGDRALEMS